MEFRKIRIRKKMNWLQIYWKPNGSSCEFEKMFALGWAKFPEDTTSCRFFEKCSNRGFRGWKISLGKFRAGYERGQYFYVPDKRSRRK